MANKNPALATLADNINQGISNRLKDLHTSMPGIIESFDAANQTATIQPAIRRIFISREGNDEILTPSKLPILINVPVQFPRGGGFSLTFPVKKGDECLLVFVERAFDSWHKFGKVQDPNARRFHSLSDATAFVGISSLPNKVPNYSSSDTQLKKDDGTAVISVNEDSSVSVTADGDITANSQGNITADAATSASVTAPTINLTGNVVITGALSVSGAATLAGGAAITGSMTNNGTDIGKTHTHPQGNDSSGDTQVNTGPPV